MLPKIKSSKPRPFADSQHLARMLRKQNRNSSELRRCRRIGIKLQSLSDREAQLEAELSRAPAADPVRFHPRMAGAYQARVSELIMRLGDGDHQQEAQEGLRGLVDRIVLTPSEESDRLDIVLEGALSGLLALALREREVSTGQAVDIIDELMLFAGVGFEPTSFRL